jgi:hypothetical protein
MLRGHLPVRSYLAVPVISRSGDILSGLFFGHPETGVGIKPEFLPHVFELVATVASVAGRTGERTSSHRASRH